MTTRRFPCPEIFDQHTGEVVSESIRREPPGPSDICVLDFSATYEMDTRGAAWLLAITDFVRSCRAEVRFENAKGIVADFIELLDPALHQAAAKRKKAFGWSTLLDRLVAVYDELADFGNLLFDALYWTFVAPFEGKGFRWNLFWDEMYEMGVRAVWINSLMNCMLGLVIAMLSAAQSRKVGLDIFVADLVIIAFARELAALMTAVVVAGRTGAAITAELATMKVQEEIDALRGMGLKIGQFLIAPRMLALLVVMPCLVTLGVIFGILGGSLWGVFVLGFDAEKWYNQTVSAAQLEDFFQGYAKCFCYALIIVLVGCHNGLRVEGGSRGVGLMTTRTVVMITFFVVLTDMLYAALFYFVL